MVHTTKCHISKFLTLAKQGSQADDVVTLDVSSSGRVFAKSQVTDYQHCGTELQSFNLVDFFTETYETEITKADREAELAREDAYRGPGHPRNARVQYLTTHPKSASVHRVIRSPRHRNLPNFLGRWFPRNNNPDIYNFYCACMLVLLKPWCDLTTDLKLQAETWTLAFETFRISTPLKVQRVLSGIQYFHECESAAHTDNTRPYPYPTLTDQTQDDGSGVDHIPNAPGFSEEGLALLKAEAIPLREEQHGRMAIEIAKHLGIFWNNQSVWQISQGTIPGNTTEADLSRIAMWSNLLQATVEGKNNMRRSDPSAATTAGAMVERSLPSDGLCGPPSPAVVLQATGSEQALPAVDPGSLKPDQLRAYRIVDWHLGETLRGTCPPPLRMILYGEGGTGKSRVIQTITELFAAHGVSHMLVKAAYTGVAASLVDGKTTHVIAGLSLGSRGGVTDALKKKLQDFWMEVQYLIVDEYSMLSKTFLAMLSRNISIGMEGSEGFQPDHTGDKDPNTHQAHAGYIGSTDNK